MGVREFLRVAVVHRALLLRVVVAFARDHGTSSRTLLGRGLAVLCLLVVALAVAPSLPGALRWLVVGVGPVIALAFLYRGLIHGLLLVPVVSISIGLAGWSGLLGLASGFEQLLIEQNRGIRGELVVSKYGLDFEEYPEIATALVRDRAIRCALPTVHGTGVLRRQDAAVGEAPSPVASSDILSELQAGRLVAIEGWPADGGACSRAFSQILAGREVGELLRPANPGQLPTAVLAEKLAARLEVGVGDRVSLVIERSPALGRRGANPDLEDGAVTREAQKIRHADFEVSATVSTGDPELDQRLVLLPLSAAQGLFFGRARISYLRVFLEDPSSAAEQAVSMAARLNRSQPRTLYRVHDNTRAETVRSGILRFRFIISLAAVGCMAVCSFSALAGLIALARRRTQSLRSLLLLGCPPGFAVVLNQAMTLWVFALGGSGALLLSLCWGRVLAANPIRLPVPGHVDDVVYEIGISITTSDLGIPALITYALLAICTALVPHAMPARAAGATRSRRLSTLGS